MRIANSESKLLWPDLEGRHPDILLSIGTAYHEERNEGTKRSAALKPLTELKTWYEIIKKRVENVLDSELTWTEFRNDVIGTSSPITAQRYVRLNPKLTSPVPKMDDTQEYDLLRSKVKNELATAAMKTSIERTAHRLIASSFYFEKTGLVNEDNGYMSIKGKYRRMLFPIRHSDNEPKVPSGASLRRNPKIYAILVSISNPSSGGVDLNPSFAFMRPCISSRDETSNWIARFSKT